MFVNAASQLKIGYGLDAVVDMGPFVTAEAKTRIKPNIANGFEEGADLLLDVRETMIEKHPVGC